MGAQRPGAGSSFDPSFHLRHGFGHHHHGWRRTVVAPPVHGKLLRYMPHLSAPIVVLAGQPNCGKTSLFNLLTGAHQYVGNWPGVTVERKEGWVELPGTLARLIDLPGAYGLTPFALDEAVTRSCLLTDPYDLILNVVDANVLERQLYLTLQLTTLARPMVLVLTMTDELAEQGLSVDLLRLSELVRIPAVAVDGRSGKGLDELRIAMDHALTASPAAKTEAPLLPGEFPDLLRRAESLLQAGPFPRFYALKYFEEDEEATSLVASLGRTAREQLEGLKRDLGRDSGRAAPAIVADRLYGAARGIARETVRPSGSRRLTRERLSGFVDRVALHPYLGIPLFLLVLLAMFELTFRGGDLLAGVLQAPLAWLAGGFGLIPIGWLASLLRNGLVGGVGNVLLVSPYIVVMFLVLSFLEDSGYMARAAYIMDRFMHKLGLHGKAFVPLVLGFGCNVPAVMAARSLESKGDRLKTILMTPFMSCSARLTVFVFFGGAFFGGRAGLVVFGLYLAGILAGLLTAFILSKSLIREKSPGFIMELPPYRLPRLSNLLINTWNKLHGFVEKAGTLILAASLVIWALSYFPAGVSFGGIASLIGRIGALIAPIFAPLHFDPTMTVGLLAGFSAKEVVISTIGVVSGQSGQALRAVIAAQMSPATALAYLSFILLYTPCLATVAVIRSESGSRAWTLFSIVYGLVLAYATALLVRSVALLAGLA